jgi:hypothetical protein
MWSPIEVVEGMPVLTGEETKLTLAKGAHCSLDLQSDWGRSMSRRHLKRCLPKRFR